MLYCRVGGFGEGGGYLNVFGLMFLLERTPGILSRRPWTLKLYGMRWWEPFGMVVCVRVLGCCRGSVLWWMGMTVG